MEEKFTVEFYETSAGKIPGLDFINTLEVKLRAKVFRDINLLEQKGNRLRLPYSRCIEDDIFELRTIQGNNIVRTLYFFFIGRKIIITNGFKKKTQKTPCGEIEKAKDYRDDYLKRHQN